MGKVSRLNRCIFYFIFIFMAFISLIVNAAEQNENELELSAIANLDTVALENDQWHTVLPVLGDENQYFIATQAGKIYQLNNNQISQSAFFDLKSTLKNSDIITLTAITLDPNFHYRDRDGYHTFYTAHTETSKKSKSKLTPKNTEVSPPYDAVVMRWKITSLQNKTPKISQQHEVIRIAIMQPQEHIQQLSFNPYIEPWHDDFGLLFIALARSETLKNEALYAGTILRIRPEKYGLKNYTTPADNPFTKTADIQNEIIFIAGLKTEHFDWIKQSTYSLLVQFNQPDTNVLIEAKIGDDWREAIPQSQIKKRWPITNKKHKTLLYQGRDIKSLWGKVLHLQENESDWQLQASTISSTGDGDTQNISHKLINHNANEQAKFSLHQKHNGELLLLEHSQQRLYTIKKPTLSVGKSNINQATVSSSGNVNTFIFILSLMFILTSYFWYFRKTSTKKQDFLQQQWANFEVDLEAKTLSLYKRHSKVPEKSINISSITRSEILLNDETISTVSADSTKAFSNDLEALVLAVFGNEHRIKMINEKQRKIQMFLTDNEDNRYQFCFYFRIGNIRHTKLKYQQVIDKAIDWQWLFSLYINPDLTAKRKIKVKPIREKTITPSAVKTTVVQTIFPEILEDNSKEVTQYVDDTNENITKNDLLVRSTNENKIAVADLDTQLISALDKLIMMKKQGYLSEAEFNVAKTKILKS